MNKGQFTDHGCYLYLAQDVLIIIFWSQNSVKTFRENSNINFPFVTDQRMTSTFIFFRALTVTVNHTLENMSNLTNLTQGFGQRVPTSKGELTFYLVSCPEIA